MVAGQCPTPEPGGPALALEAWLRPLQQALQLEADRGFENLQGRRERFHAFLARELRQHPGSVNPPQGQALVELAGAFDAYPEQSLGRRQTLVRRSRQLLHELHRSQQPVLPVAPPRLRLVQTPAVAQWIQPDTPLSQIRGVGPKTAEKFAVLGLFVAADLLRYYPRDYLDYANLVRIAALVPGRTATIVATVLRTNSFTSPRNPNLSILELQLQDVTGKLRVSKFFAGKRFSSPGWLKGQQRLYPPGATVAVSGLVKETPYGPVFQDPLMEVLDSPNAPLQSRDIGRLLPVYGLTEGLSAEKVRSAVEPVVMAALDWGDHLPPALLELEGLMALPLALAQIHQPQSQESLSAARRRLVFDEFLLLQLGLLQRRRELTSRPAPPLALPTAAGSSNLVADFLDLLPFPLTGAQQRVLAEIRSDLVGNSPWLAWCRGTWAAARPWWPSPHSSPPSMRAVREH